jgi:hypothetical protein
MSTAASAPMPAAVASRPASTCWAVSADASGARGTAGRAQLRRDLLLIYYVFTAGMPVEDFMSVFARLLPPVAIGPLPLM